MSIVFLPRRLRERLGTAQGEIVSASAFNRVVREIGCTHLPVYVTGDIPDVDHLLDVHLYPEQP